MRSRGTVLVAASVMALCTGAPVPASQIVRMDIYDKADNQLLFVTFDYNGAGDCTGRSVYASDSTFLRSTRFTKDTGGTVTAENSFDYESNPLFTTRLSPQTGRTDFTVSDQFAMDLLGAPMSYAAGAAGEYVISQGGATIYKQKYEYAGDGSLTRIDYSDASGALLFYATITQSTGAVPGSGRSLQARLAPVFRTTADGKLLASFTLATACIATLELFTPSGRLVAKTVGRSLGAGRRTLSVAGGSVSGAGAYLARISVNGTPVYYGRLLAAR